MVSRVNNVPPLDLTQQYAQIGDEIGAAVQKVLASGGYIGGPAVKSFEQEFANYTGVSDCVGCNSGTDALILALRALKIGPGDEVITTPFTFFASAETISAVGATPVFVDIDSGTFNLDVELLEAAITDKTKAIMPVHIFGQPTDMTRLMEIATKHNLAVIEDCAQSVGAEWESRKVGSIGHVGCFSFYPTKNLGACGDGGAVTTNDRALAASMRMLKEHGQSSRYFYEEIGYNSRLDALQAVILSIKLRYLDSWNSQRREKAAVYSEFLSRVPGVAVPKELPAAKPVWNQYTIRLTSQDTIRLTSPEGAPNPSGNFRDSMRTKLQESGIGSMVYYPLPLHLQPVYKSLGYQAGQLPVAEQVCREVLSLPMFPELSRDQQERAIYGLKDCLAKGG
ncbi:MAG: DegT/DnrJ/EryC1/StrS family aminotransferase [Oscillatoriales cyanobacterium]|nr:MAG: DegT/DnrJ/EryC1/StrS family aminotransferase [Oscillatoriales cyanobacterium]TAE18737.1 MAG: DegT/DnrJ/EryC1/StrS family aminotransferase [Oscillatoriales cyanobacterium]TAE41637.1 MAG: DegT/DnrJ/EryC1/StrS family aminotransferase [Oscillatoriales cyanobacterium]TAE51027.1 MAG: DegT/DnrJ/EryC1/StrS family aminotransferase [Oscillatoriales cyanobacterium]TAE66225.1 MAG: DegT/DnrJ/EryC1/StrS family aminotransferase [Oscillatoriales cyanobacterium]